MEKINNLKALIEYENQTFWVDLTGLRKGGDAVIEVIEKDGTHRKATTSDAGFMELLGEGHVIGRSLPKV